MPPEEDGLQGRADPAARVRILLVEDHDLLAGTLSMALRWKGFEVESTAGPTPEAVVDAARGFAPELVFLDLDLGPLGSGRDLVRPLRATGSRVIILTGSTNRMQLAACVQEGAGAVLSKSLPFEELLDAIDRLAAGEELLAPSHREAMVAELRDHVRAEADLMAAFDSLTAREREVLARMMAGQSAEEAAAASFVSVATIRSQIQSVLRKLGVNSQLAAVALARQAGWSGRIHQM